MAIEIKEFIGDGNIKKVKEKENSHKKTQQNKVKKTQVKKGNKA